MESVIGVASMPSDLALEAAVAPERGAEHDAERATLRLFLDAQRDSVLAIVDGLSDEQLRQPVLPSGWTPLGMVEHLGRAERFWFQRVVTGRCRELPWQAEPDSGDGPFQSAHPASEVLDFYREQGRIGDEVLATTPLDFRPITADLSSVLAALATSVRTIALHMIEETARHAGHLDAARELIDGRTGLGPR